MIRLMAMALILAIGASCQDDHRWQAPPLETTPKGIRVYVPPDAAATYGRETVLHWVDYQAAVWILMKGYWGVGDYSDEELWDFVRLVPVIGYDGQAVPGDGQDVYAGFNWFGSRIEASTSVLWIDGYGFLGFGCLPHEFTHTVRGNFH